MLRSGYGLGGLTLDIGHGYNFFNVSFTNRAKVAATRVVFQIDFNASRYVIADVGSYAPGVTVTHTLRDHGKSVQASARPGGKGPTQCAVLSAHFADGTTWVTPAASAASATP